MFNPKPKPHRVKDELFSIKIRNRDGRCIAGMLMEKSGERLADGQFQWECSEGLDAHHIKSKGSGGGDTYENGISLCRRHHQLAHRNLITREMMLGWLEFLYGGKHE